MNHIRAPRAATTTDYAGRRQWAGPVYFRQCPTLSRAWELSSGVLADMEAALHDFDPQGEVIHTLAVAGSLGRMEALPHSDCDLIVIVPDSIAPDSEAIRPIMETVWERLQPLGLRLPKSWGIFVEPASGAGLTRPGSLGDLDESGKLFGKRLQCLLDSQPVYRKEAFAGLQRRILEWYATGFLVRDPDKEWTYLLNDLIRYYRSYAAWQQFELKIEHDDSWYIRNAKLRTSRLIMYAGMLLLLGECSRLGGDDKITWLHEKLTLTPLERVTWCMQRYDDGRDIEQLLKSYEIFLAAMADDRQRIALIEKAPRTLEDLPPQEIPEYAPIRDSSERIMEILTRFTLARAGDWSRRFMHYLFY